MDLFPINRLAGWSIACVVLMWFSTSPIAAQLQQDPHPAFATAGFVPDQQCATCHRAIWKTYQRVGMAQSFYRPRTDNIIEDFVNNQYHHEPSGRHYEMNRRDDGWFMRRFQLDDDGKPIHEIEKRIDWIIGSGSHSRGYLYQTEAGELFQLPIVWYTQSQSWGMAPGYDRPDHDGITRQIDRNCMFCHNAYPMVAAGSDAPESPQIFPTNLPEGIGCQRCHGPGAEHVRLANDFDASVEHVRASIFGMKNASAMQRDDVCFQCHLQPTSRLSSFTRVLGRNQYDYRPGQRLQDYMLHFDFDAQDDPKARFEIDHHPYRLRQSVCFLKSNGQMSCLTCHDPHRKVPSTEAPTYYRNKCLTCHSDEDCSMESMNDSSGITAKPLNVPSNDCIACHMPKRRTQDVVSVVMTDHLIQRRIMVSDPTGPLTEQEPPVGAEVRFYFPERTPNDALAEVYLNMQAVRDGNLSKLQALTESLQQAMPVAAEPYIELGIGRIKASQYAHAITSLIIALQHDPDSRLAYSNLGMAWEGQGEHESAVQAFRQALEIEPFSPDTHFNLATTLARMGETDAALKHYDDAIRQRPNYAKAHFNRGNLLARRDEYEPAVTSFESSLAIEPDQPDAARNMAAALRHLNRLPESLRILKQTRQRFPDHPQLLMDLALMYLASEDQQQRDLPSALKTAAHLSELYPDNATVTAVYALSLLLNQHSDEAGRTLDRAVALGLGKYEKQLMAGIQQALAGDHLRARGVITAIHNQQIHQPYETRFHSVQMLILNELIRDQQHQ